MEDILVRADGWLCGMLRSDISADPFWVVVWCCVWRPAAGSQGMIEPIFNVAALRFSAGDPKPRSRVSTASGAKVLVHYRAERGTKTHLVFAHWCDRPGVHGGTFDNPGWIDVTPGIGRYVCLGSAARAFLSASRSNGGSRMGSTAHRSLL